MLLLLCLVSFLGILSYCFRYPFINKFSLLLGFVFTLLLMVISYGYSFNRELPILNNIIVEEEITPLVNIGDDISLLDMDSNYLYFYKDENGKVIKDTIPKCFVKKIYFDSSSPYLKKVVTKKSYSSNINKVIFFPLFIDNYIFNYQFEIYIPKGFEIK